MVLLIIICIGPITDDVIKKVCKDSFKIKGSKEFNDIQFIISLCVALQVVDKKLHNGKVYYFCSKYENLKTNNAMHSLLEKSQHIRSRCLSHLVYIDEYNEFLSEVI